MELENRDDADVLQAYLKAFEFRPSRAESLCALARYLRLRKRHELAYLFAKRAAETPKPDDLLFVDTSVYAWRALDELSIAAHYVGRYQEAIDLTRTLLTAGQLPIAERDRVGKNQAFSVTALATK